MKKKIIVIEKNEKLKGNIKKQLVSLIDNNKDDIEFWTFSSLDKNSVKTLFGNVKVRNILQKGDYSLNTEAYNKTHLLVDTISDKFSDNAIKSIVKSLFGNIYILFKQSFRLNEELARLINDELEVVLVGKELNNPVNQSLFIRKIFEYENMVSYWTCKICSDKKVKLTIIKTDKTLLKFMYYNIQPILLVLGNLIQNPFVYAKKSEENFNSSMISFRSTTHKKVYDNMVKNGFDNINASYILNKKLIGIDCNLKNNYQFKTIKINYFNVVKLMFNFALRKNIKKTCKEFGLSWKYVFYSIVFNYSIYRNLISVFDSENIKEYYNFEETNFYGALISYAAKQNSIKCTTIQHGYTVSYDNTMPLISDERWVWGESFARKYNELGIDRASLKNINELLYNKVELVKVNKKSELNLLLAPEYSEYYLDLNNWISNIIRGINTVKINKIVISLHPNQKGSNEIKQHFNESRHNFDIQFTVGFKKEDFLNSNIIITGNTTVGYEAVLNGKFVIYFNMNNYTLYDYLQDDFIIEVKDNVDIEKAFNQIINTDYNNFVELRNKFINKYC